MEDYCVRSPQKGLREVSQHHQATAENGLTQRCEPARAEVNRTVPLHIQGHPPAALSQREQQRDFSHQRLFLLTNELHYIAAAIYSLGITEDIFLLAHLFKKRELLSSVLNCILKFKDKI